MSGTDGQMSETVIAGGDRTGDRVGEGGKCPGVGRIWRLATLVVD